MNQANAHRGPDGTGIFTDDSVSLGHNRLSIIDLSDRASQPMKSADETLVIIFNGEIYNFERLKKELVNEYPFKTNSDTEVILAAYQKWGHNAVKKLNGIFAFAIWDCKKKELFIARDHLGIKPFYYCINGKQFIFSSEIKAILEHPIPRKFNTEAFNHYLRILYVPEPLTMFDGIYKLPPASFGVVKDGILTIQKFWQVEPGNYLTEPQAYIEREVFNKISASVEQQLISDRPLGIYLSGGIDSSTILHCVAQKYRKINTFSVGFNLRNEKVEEKFNTDLYLARKTAMHYGASHHEVMLSTEDVPELFTKAIRHMDEPISNPTALAMIKLAAFAKDRVTVALGGDGGDELFGGYERYRLSLIASYYQKLPRALRILFSWNDKLRKLNTATGIDRFTLFMFQKNGILERTIHPEWLNKTISEEFFNKKYFIPGRNRRFEEIFMNTDRQSWLVDQSLMLTDKMSMASGLEVRVPLLDKDLVELAARIPLKYKVSPFNTKIILKSAVKGRIPSFLLDQPKRGWFAPGAKWLRYPSVYTFAQNVLSPEYYSETSPIFSWKEIKKILDDHCAGRQYNLVILWALMTFQLWAREFNISGSAKHFPDDARN